MADVVHDDVLEQILIELDVKDLIRCKSVCKSWYSLITSSRFIKRHLNRSYNKDRYNNNIGHRRVIVFEHSSFDNLDLVGSSNGLVCIFCSGYKLIVGNPLTREVRQLTYPTVSVPSCWGFGYDSSTDDYKVIVGTRKGESKTCFQLLSLKSNVWRDVGEENYRMFMGRVGILYNGALYWIVVDQNYNTFIISFALSREEFKEIPLPDYDARYKCTCGRGHMGIVKECLCIVGNSRYTWLMKKYHVKKSWELVEIPHDDKKYDILHTLRLGFPFLYDAKSYHTFDKCWIYATIPIFVQSLVSPHVSEVAKEFEINQTLSVLNKTVNLSEPSEKLQEVVKESVAALTERNDLGGRHLQSSEHVVQQDEAAVNPSVND